MKTKTQKVVKQRVPNFRRVPADGTLEEGYRARRVKSAAEKEKMVAAATLTAGMMGPPVAPGGGVGAEADAGDVLQGLEDPAAGGGVERSIVHHLEETGDGAQALLLREHAGLCEGAGGSFTDVRRRVAAERFEKWRDRTVRGEKVETDYGIGARGLIGIMDAIEEDGFEARGFHAAIAENAENPEEPSAMFRLVLQASEKLVHAFGGLGQIVAGQSDFEGSGADAEVVGVDGSVEQIRERTFFHFKLAVPAGNIFFDEFDGAFVVVDGAFHEEFGSLLRGHGGKAFDFVAGEFCRRRGEGIALQLNDAFELGPGGFDGGGVGG